MMIVSKILFFFLVFAILIVIKEFFFFVGSFVTNTKMEVNTKRQMILASAISYIFTIIFTGFSI